MVEGPGNSGRSSNTYRGNPGRSWGIPENPPADSPYCSGCTLNLGNCGRSWEMLGNPPRENAAGGMRDGRKIPGSPPGAVREILGNPGESWESWIPLPARLGNSPCSDDIPGFSRITLVKPAGFLTPQLAFPAAPGWMAGRLASRLAGRVPGWSERQVFSRGRACRTA